MNKNEQIKALRETLKRASLDIESLIAAEKDQHEKDMFIIASDNIVNALHYLHTKGENK